mmetsp:Transcript_90224/g.257993  ORF Transcript_90224/g.257993 Transcript_90224/m.257993 type:complete len:98 (+) Transcript_90224:441-734(+)
MNMFPGYTARYNMPIVKEAIDEYKKIANFHGLSLTQMALSWCYTRPFVASTIIGASTVDQLHENLQATNCPLTEDMAREIYQVFLKYRDPTKGGASV